LTSDPLADFQHNRKPHPNRLKENQQPSGADVNCPTDGRLLQRRASATETSTGRLEERRSANEHEEKFDDCDLPDGGFGSQPCRQLCAGYYYV
jgi:hypothetical protein